MTRVVLASRNAHKIEEMNRILDDAGLHVEVVGIDASTQILGSPVVGDPRIGQTIPDAQPRQRPRLGKGLHHKQIVVARHQRHGAFAAEIDIGLVDHHQLVRMLREKRLDRKSVV